MIKPRIGIAIPVCNVENAVEKVLQAFTPETLEKIEEVLVIDNNSSDNTFQVVQKYLDANTPLGKRLSIIRHAENYGYGSSIKTAFDYFIQSGKTHVIIIHGDNQSNSEVLTKNFLEVYAQDPNLDLITTSRFLPASNIQGYSWLRTAGNYFFNWVTYITTGLKMTDSGAAIIFVKTELLKRLPYACVSNSWQFHPQLNIFIHSDKSIKIKEIPLDWTDSEAKSGLNLTSYGMKLLKILIGYRISKTFLRKKNHEIFKPEGATVERNFKLYTSTAGN